MKKIIFLMLVILISSCAEERCICCMAQNKNTKTIVENKGTCSESSSFLSGFQAGFRDRFIYQLDSIEVICN